MDQFCYVITPGIIALEDDAVSVIIDHTDVKIIHINTRSKYIGDVLFDFDPDNGAIAARLYADEDTLRTSEEHAFDEPTIVSFPSMAGYWNYFAEASRYSVYIALFMQGREG